MATPNHLPLVHVDDLGIGYLRAVESSMRGEIFNLADPSRLTLHELVAAIARLAGYRGELRALPVSQAAQTMGADGEIYAMDVLEDASKARRLLGWEPRHTNFTDDVDTYFEAWKAWHLQEIQSQQPQPAGHLAF
jgi:nucleoside-diphosphate-sugar epimerase